MKNLSICCGIFAICLSFSARATAQESEQANEKEDSVIIPSQMELNDEQKQELQTFLNKQLTSTVTTCVSKYPRPEFFTELGVQFELKKSGSLRGGYVPAGVIDSSLYVASDEEKAKLKDAGSLARLVVRSDRDLERCLKKGTRQLNTKFKRYAASVSATYSMSWKGKTPTLTSSTFEITKK